MSNRAWLLAGVWSAVTGGLAVIAGCYGHNCDGDAQHWGKNPNEGQLVDVNTWQSTPVDADWLFFPHQRFWDFDLSAMGDRTPTLVVPYVSASRNPVAVGDNFTVGGGNLTEISSVSTAHVTIHNGTCADYYLRLVVVAPPNPPQATVPQGIADAGTNEGGTP